MRVNNYSFLACKYILIASEKTTKPLSNSSKFRDTHSEFEQIQFNIPSRGAISRARSFPRLLTVSADQFTIKSEESYAPWQSDNRFGRGGRSPRYQSSILRGFSLEGGLWGRECGTSAGCQQRVVLGVSQVLYATAARHVGGDHLWGL